MLIPRYSIRLLLLITTVCSVFFYVVMLANRGHVWALAVTICVSSVFAVLLLHAAVFLLAWSLALIGDILTTRQVASSPFATAKPPPQQVVPPEDPE